MTSLLDRFYDAGHAGRVGADVHDLIARMYPICRSITGDGVRRTLGILDDWITLEKFEVPTGTTVFDWEVPREWNIRDAYIANEAGRRLVDFRANNLHVVSYSTPIDMVMSRSELAPHLVLDAGSARLDPVPNELLQGALGVLPAPP